jgi:uncharacterized repeat protein (TIGR01451 family)
MMRLFSAWRARGRLAVALCFAALVALGLSSAASAATISSAGPLTAITISPDLNCSVNHAGDTAGEWFGDTACGTLAVDLSTNTLYGPGVIPAGGSAAPRTTYTTISQTGPTGTGTSGDPFTIVTVVGLGGSGLTITQTDAYVVGQESYRTDVQISNATAAPKNVRLYAAGDCFLQNSDFGFGLVDASTGSVACTVSPAPGSRIEQLFPLTAGSRYFETFFNTMWAQIGQQLQNPNACDCATDEDNAVSLSWDETVPANGSVTVSHITTFSPLGVQPLSTTKTADSAGVLPGGSDGYTITIHNPNASAVTVNSITDTLPAGFTYSAGTTTGATTTDPTVAGQTLTWTGPFTAPASEDVSLHFNVTVSSTPGTYFNNAGGDAGAVAVAPTGDTAPVTVQGVNATHAIAFTKGCISPTMIAAPYTCSYQILNTVDTAHDDLSITGLSDVVHTAGGDQPSGSILGALQLVFTGPVTCVGGSGAGTAASPYVGATSCTLPFGSSIATNGFTFYMVQPSDFGLPGHLVTDDAALSWHDLCTGTSGNCTTSPQTATASSSAQITISPAVTMATAIHNAGEQVVTTVEAGTTVHDVVTVLASPPFVPTGNVTLDWFFNGTCSGGPAISSGPLPLVNGQLDATAFSMTPHTAGQRAFLAHYQGDPLFGAIDGPCEPLQVVDARIQVTPATAQNPIGTNHTLTGHVDVDDGLGAGFVNAPDGTVINFSIANGPGSFVGPSSCTTAGGTGSCTVAITSGAPGTTTVHATTNVTVGGVSLTRATGDGDPLDSPDATKDWVKPVGLIAPSGTSCSDYVNGTAAAQDHVNYTVKKGVIWQSINPGVFFYYTTITTTTPNQVVTVSQSNTSTNNAAPFGILNGQAWLYPATCGAHTVGTTTGPNDSGASFTIATPGTYVIGIKYQTKTIAGTAPPVPADITYTFTTSLGGGTNASVLLTSH